MRLQFMWVMGKKENHSWCEWNNSKTVHFLHVHTYQISFVRALTFYPHISHLCPSFSTFTYSYSIISTHMDWLFFFFVPFHTQRYSPTLYISNTGWRLSWELIFTVFSTHSGDRRSIGIRGRKRQYEPPLTDSWMHGESWHWLVSVWLLTKNKYLQNLTSELQQPRFNLFTFNMYLSDATAAFRKLPRGRTESRRLQKGGGQFEEKHAAWILPAD